MKSSRRSFLKTGLALPALGAASVIAQTPAGKDSSFDPWVEIHPGNLRHNINAINRRVASRPILAVIKNNGYGMGVSHAARLLEPMPEIYGFAVVKLHEAATLRDAGIRKPILLMGPFDEKSLIEAVRRGITPMVYTPIGAFLDRISAKFRRAIPIHVCVDTGLGRVGVPHLEAAALIRDLAGRRSARIAGVMMTFTEDQEFDQEQLRRFEALCGGLEKEGVRLGRKHAVSSFGLFQHPAAFFDMARPGMAIYGIYSEKEFRSARVMDLRPALSLKARVIYAKKLRRGESAGYNRAYVAKDDVWVATLPVGHADGWPRQAAKGARVRIGESLYPVIASVSASHTIVELGSETSVRIGDVVTLFDWREGSRPEDVAAACGSSVYDLTMHLNALLPRRIVQSAPV
jgi:alanine racemase